MFRVLSYPSHAVFVLFFYVGSFSYTSRAVFIFMWGVSLTHPVLTSFFLLYIFLFGDFLLNILCWFLSFFLLFVLFYFLFYRRSFSYTTCAGFIFMWGVSLTHLMLAWCLSVEFLWHIPCWLHFFFFFFFFFLSGEFHLHTHAGFIFVWGVTCPMLWGVSLTHPMLSFFFMSGVSPTHPMLTLFLCGEFLLHIPCCLHF